MPLAHDLRNAIQSALTGLSVVGLSSTVVWDLYEQFILTVVIDAAHSQGAAIEHRDMAGNVTHLLRFPTGPRAIHKGNYTHVHISFPKKKPLEAHLGVYVLGKSKVEHECDVLVLLEDEADKCRQRAGANAGTQFHPLARAVVAFAECKCYQATRLSISHGRAFVGLSQDIRPHDVCAAFVSTKTHDPVGKLLVAHNRVFGENLKPGNTNEISWLRGKFADRFHTFKQKP